ncbi:UDP-N-acetylglucosamine 4,6-dehydratase [Anaerobacillus alkalidiazotrophicus]|uniref:UDP-N-acetylglucosamine 4,6-dehydratase n=1 Tax=Anaerobacillus alkalidiazotrophicus TaxID=472963 RepID=A0A1S2M1P9_9BACI|nr:polysaccharide biosynthesis protein [Anaerobacillus alkalidiazotrophicus]OIJ18544.1 UDP-N-acetylglucosamine 4,6-dehydratase [Anaerobacillus alkalidiazotrophicus]
MFNDQTILITGGTGSWGYELVRQLVTKKPKEIRIFSRNESSQVEMKQKFENNEKLSFIIGDIRDFEALNEASIGVDSIFHLAALKHVPVCEDQPYEALKTNVLGTKNVIDAALKQAVKNVIYISTDKAADPSNFYGLSKAMGERLIIHANLLKSKTKFVCVRGGNVLGTNGSVVPVFKKQIAEKSKITITDHQMTRFFLTIEDAIRLLFKATYESKGGEIFVMKMPTCKIIDLAHVLIEASGKEDVKIEMTGIRPGEKLHEVLFTEYESQHTVYYDDEYYVILPTIDMKGLNEHYSQYKIVELSNYNSSESLMTKAEIKEILLRGGFI